MKEYNNGLNNWANIFKRTTDAPLDLSATFDNLAALKDYVDGKDESLPYLAQIVGVDDDSALSDGTGDAAVYIITKVGSVANNTEGEYKRLALTDDIGTAGSLFNWQDDNITAVSDLTGNTTMQSGYAYRYNGSSSGTIPAANMASGVATTVAKNDIVICVIGMGDESEPSANKFLVISTGISQETLDALTANFVNAVKITVDNAGTYDSEKDWYQGCISSTDVANLITLHGDITTTTRANIKPSSLAITFAANANDKLFKVDSDTPSFIATAGFNITALVHGTTLTSAESAVYNKALELSFYKEGYEWIIKIMFNSSDATKSCVKSSYIKYGD